MNTAYSVHVVPDETTDREPCYVASHPELHGCMSHGATVAEAIAGLQAARDLYLKTLEELGQPIPPPPEHPTFVIWQNFSAPLAKEGAAHPVMPVSELQPAAK